MLMPTPAKKLLEERDFDAALEKLVERDAVTVILSVTVALSRRSCGL